MPRWKHQGSGIVHESQPLGYVWNGQLSCDELVRLKNSKRHWAKSVNLEMLTAFSAVVVGACALVIAFYEVRIMRADQRSSVLPLLELSSSTHRKSRDDSGTLIGEVDLEFNAENVGIGPARVVDFRVTVDGRPVQTWEDAMRALLDSNESTGHGFSKIKQQPLSGSTLPAGRHIELIRIRGNDSVGEISANFDRLDFEACYCSVFDECWVVTFQKAGTNKEVARCEPDSDSFNE